MLSGVILAGGVHGRMGGENRALLSIYGELLIQRQIREMESICDEIIIVTNDPKPFLRVVDVSVRIITDFIRGQGALGGMHAGLSLAEHEEVWVVGCHMPSISAQAAQFMQQFKHEFKLEAVVPRIDGKLVMLHGIYDKAISNQIMTLLNRGDKGKEQLLQHIKWSEMDSDQFVVRGIETRFTQMIKTMDDYQQYLARYYHIDDYNERLDYLE
jgi:molybdopterin-guanine dinucleotide biosynthesis protein A